MARAARETAADAGHSSGRMDDLGLILLLLLVALLVLIAAAGIAFQQLGLWNDARRFPPPGRLIDVGGCRLHVDVRGAGSPAVVFEAGVAATSLSWRLVQTEIAKTTTTVTYDRAWLGWSDPAFEQRSLPQVVQEVKQLLDRAQVKGPVILVAHSYGALVARLYQAHDAANVAGIVLVDPMAIGEWSPPSVLLRQTLDRGISLSRRGAWLARLGIVRLALRLLLRGGRRVPKLIAHATSGKDSWFTDRIAGQIRKLPRESWPLIQSHWSNPKCFEGMARYLEALPESAATVTREALPAALRGVPVTILSAETATAKERAEHEALALDSQAHLEIVPGSGHWIQLDRPDAVIAAVVAIIAQIRASTAQRSEN